MLCICTVTWQWHMACLGEHTTLSVLRRSEDMDLHCQDIDIASLLWLIWKPETGWLAVDLGCPVDVSYAYPPARLH